MRQWHLFGFSLPCWEMFMSDVVLPCLTCSLSPGGKGVNRKFPWNWIFVHWGKGFQLLYATSWGDGFLTVAEKGFHYFSLADVVVGTSEWAQLWTYSVATITSQIFAHEFFVQFRCMRDCCCYSGDGREWGEESPHQSAEIHLPSLTVAYCLSLLAVNNWPQGNDFS